MKKHGVKIQKANSKCTMGIVKRYNRTLAERLFWIQDASDLLLPISKRSRAWVKNLPIIVKELNNSVTQLLKMTLVEAIQKKWVSAMPSLPRNGPVGFDEPRLSYNILVRYLLELGELEGGRHRATDCNWSPKVYYIKESLIQKNQPVLYWLTDENSNGPERSFVREQLIKVDKIEYPPKWVLRD